MRRNVCAETKTAIDPQKNCKKYFKAQSTIKLCENFFSILL